MSAPCTLRSCHPRVKHLACHTSDHDAMNSILMWAQDDVNASTRASATPAGRELRPIPVAPDLGMNSRHSEGHAADPHNRVRTMPSWVHRTQVRLPPGRRLLQHQRRVSMTAAATGEPPWPRDRTPPATSTTAPAQTRCPARTRRPDPRTRRRPPQQSAQAIPETDGCTRNVVDGNRIEHADP